MQKQNPKTTLLCTFRNCKNPQDDQGEFCPKHYPKKGRNDLIEALNQLDEWADGYTSSFKEKKLQEKLYDLVMDFITNS